MRENHAYAGTRILIVLCVLAGCLALGMLNARAADDPVTENVTVSDAEASLNEASETRDRAMEVNSLFLAQKALEEAEAAALQLTTLSENSRLMGEIDTARLTADIAGQTSSVVADLVTMPRKAVTTALPFAGLGTTSIALASRSLNVAERLCKLVWSFDRMALERGDSELKQTVRKAAQSIRATIKEVADTATYIAGTSQNAEEVSLAQEVKDRSQNIQYCIIDEDEGVPECIGPDCDPPASAV